jgi:hypothetical protein
MGREKARSSGMNLMRKPIERQAINALQSVRLTPLKKFGKLGLNMVDPNVNFGFDLSVHFTRCRIQRNPFIDHSRYLFRSLTAVVRAV